MMYKQIYQFIHSHKKSFFIFLIVGALSALVNLASFGVMWQVLGLNYLFAATVSYILSVLFHFTCNRRFTFKNHGNNLYQQIKKYIVMVTLNLGITLLVVRTIVDVLHLSPYLGIVGAIAFTVTIGYCMSRFWVFHIVVE